MTQEDQMLLLAQAEIDSPVALARRVLGTLEAARVTPDRETYAKLMLEADLYGTVLHEEIEKRREFDAGCGISVAPGDDDDDVDAEVDEELEDEDDDLEDDEEEEEDDDDEFEERAELGGVGPRRS
jgi:hypothetical protein